MSDENTLSGNYFFLDMRTGMQYAAKFENGKMVGGIKSFSEDGEVKPLSLKPNEAVYALQDEFEIMSDGRGDMFVSTTAWQISSDASGHKTISFVPVIFEVIIRDLGPAAGRTIELEMLPESVEMISQAGFDTAFPQSTPKQSLPRGADPYTLPFLPQHKTQRAEIARSLTRLSLPVAKDSVRDSFGKSAEAPRKNYQIPDEKIEEMIKEFCKDLSDLAVSGKLDPVVGREQETEQALKVLTRRKQSSLAFIGEAGVGKTAMFYAVAQRLADDKNLPESLQDARVLELDIQAMVAGSKYRGQFEERIKPLFDGLAEREGVLKGRKVILAIDEIHAQLAAGGAEGSSNAGNMIKSALTSRGLSVMGATTDTEYRKHIEKDPALVRRFEKVYLSPPDEQNTITILKTLWPLSRDYNHLTADLTDADFRYIVAMTNRYAPQEAQPSKSEKVMNMAAASAEFEHRTAINRSDIIAAVSQMSGLPVDFLNQNDHERFLKLQEELPKEILGQPELQRVIDGLIGARSGLNDPKQPWGCFVFQGPTGTGKTEACKALARYLFGTEDALIKLDMAEYSDKHTVSRLIGAPPGFVGFDSAEPALTEKIRQRPYSILLLDEIEKAHPDVFNVLLPVLNDGKMTDNQGKTALFNNVIIVMTSNAGASEAMELVESGGSRKDVGFGSTDKKMSDEKLREELAKIYKHAISSPTPSPDGGVRGATFRPEMINRIEELGGFIVFQPLSTEVVGKLVDREIKKVSKRFSSSDGAGVEGVTLVVSDAVREQLSKEGYNRMMGARPLRKVVREKLANPLGKWLMSNKEEILSFIKEAGEARIVVESLDNFAPKLEKAEAVVANDNATPAAASPKKQKRPSGPAA